GHVRVGSQYGRRGLHTRARDVLRIAAANSGVKLAQLAREIPGRQPRERGRIEGLIAFGASSMACTARDKEPLAARSALEIVKLTQEIPGFAAGERRSRQRLDTTSSG